MGEDQELKLIDCKPKEVVLKPSALPRKRWPKPLTPKRPAENTDENYLRSLHIAVFVVCAYEGTFVLLPLVISSIEIGIAMSHLNVDTDATLIHWLILFALICSATGTIATLVLLQLGLHRYKDIFIIPYLAFKLFRVVAFTSGGIILVINRLDYWYLIPIGIADLIMGILAIDIVWRTKEFVQMMARRIQNRATPRNC